MQKEFDTWNEKKKVLHDREVVLYYRSREIWWCYVGINIGSEQNGSQDKFLRPVVIVHAFGKNSCLVVPLTTSTKVHPMRIPIGVVEGEQATALLSQIKVVDTKRLLQKIAVLDKEYFDKITKTLKSLF